MLPRLDVCVSAPKAVLCQWGGGRGEGEALLGRDKLPLSVYAGFLVCPGVGFSRKLTLGPPQPPSIYTCVHTHPSGDLGLQEERQEARPEPL